jgi:tRNA(Arg) A34 adenosine deaminase TadA
MIDPAELMRLAVAKAREGIAAGQTPFGCAIAHRDRVVAVAHNTVLADTDITAHAEIVALRQACRAAGDITLEGSIVATTCEPCPMCAAALHWARVATVHFGAAIADAQDAGFNELQLPAADLLSMGRSSVRLEAGLLAEDCRRLFHEWRHSPQPRAY